MVLSLCSDIILELIFITGWRLDEIAEELHAEEDLGDILLFPPHDGEVTDEDSGDENDASILHLSSHSR